MLIHLKLFDSTYFAQEYITAPEHYYWSYSAWPEDITHGKLNSFNCPSVQDWKQSLKNHLSLTVKKIF